MTATPKFVDWLADRLGSHMWVVARATPHLRTRYDVFLSRTKFAALREEYLRTFNRAAA